MNYLKTFIQGSIMGIAEVIPGISGSTLALIMGIYDDFIALLYQGAQLVKELLMLLLGKSSLAKAKEQFLAINFKFAILLGTGMVFAIGVFSNIIHYLFENYPAYVYAVFFGMVLVSVTIPYKHLRTLNAKNIFLIILTFILVYLLLGLKANTSETSPGRLLLFFGGCVGIMGMFLPGISGSFILLVLGIYNYVFSIIRDLTHLEAQPAQITDLAIFLVGIGAGFLTFIKILKYLLQHHHQTLMAIITGLLAGSLRVLWPFIEVHGEPEDLNFVQVRPWDLANDKLVLISGFIILSAVLTWFITRKMSSQKELKNVKIN